MLVKLKFSVEIRRSQPCSRRHADEPPEQLAPVTDARIQLAPGWDYDSRSPAVAAQFGFRPARHADAGPVAP